MLRHRTLIEVLGQVNSADVTGAMLFNREGTVAYRSIDTVISYLRCRSAAGVQRLRRGQRRQRLGRPHIQHLGRLRQKGYGGID